MIRLEAIKQKVKALLAEDRPWRLRLVMAAIAGGALSFTFILFGGIDLFVSNRDAIPLYLIDFIAPLFVLFLLAGGVLAGIFFIFRGKLFDMVLSLAVGVLLAGYLQGNFFNLPLGELTGDAVPWSIYARHTLFNLAVWVVLVCAPLVLRFFSARVWRGFVVFVPGLIVAVQLVAMVIQLGTTGALADRPDDRYLSRQGIYELSSKDNVVVFVVDRLDTLYVDAVNARDSAFFEPLDGFTYFADNTALFARTFPSTAYLTTGAIYDFQEPKSEFFDRAWEETGFLPGLRDAGYAIRLYTGGEEVEFSSFDQVEGLVDNITSSATKVDIGMMLKRLMRFSGFRYAPMALKPTFWMTTYDFYDVLQGSSGPRLYTEDDLVFYNDLQREGMRLQDGAGTFSMYHLHGSHSPYNLDENLNHLPLENGEPISQTMGCMRIIYAYLDQMRALGVYDDATIIITGDHGISEDVHNLDRAKTTAIFIKPKGAAGTPLQVSQAQVSHQQFQATILKSEGLDAAGYGPSYFDIPEGEDTTRPFYYRVSFSKLSEGYIEVYEVNGRARDFANWRKLDELPLTYH